MTDLHALNANLFVVLEAVLEERSVSAAAQRLGVSQPAVSNQLAKLRELFHDPLLVRVGSGMTLTPRAESVLPQLQQGLSALRAVLHDQEHFDPASCKEAFRLAMMDMAEVALLPRLLARLRREAPLASLQVFSGGPFEVSRGVATGEIDAVVGMVHSGELGDTLFESKLFATGLQVIARADHDAIQGRLSLEAYCALEHVIVTSRAGALGVIDSWLAERGLSRRLVARVPRASLVPPLVASSDLVAAVDAPVLGLYEGQLALQFVEVEDLKLPSGFVSMVWHERTHRDPARRFLREMIQHEAALINQPAGP